LAGPAFRSQYATAVNIPEISEGKRVMRLGIFGPLVVDPQKPFAVFGKTVETDIFAFLQGRRLMLAPVIALVEYESSFIDELFGMLIRSSVKRHGHGYSPVCEAGNAIEDSRAFDALTAINNRVS
jgi:hypothetical protein